MSTTEAQTTPRVNDHREWVPFASEAHVQKIAARCRAMVPGSIASEVERLVQEHRTEHDLRCINLNPATNLLNPRAEAMLASGIGTRVSLGYPGAKYEMGLESLEQIEVMAATLAAQVFGARYAEVRVPSGAMANLYAFMATCQPGDTLIAPPAAIGGHVTHHASGCAGLYGLRTLAAPVDAQRYTVDIDLLRALAHRERPRLITIGGSMNLYAHPVADVRGIADEIGAHVLFDAAHLSGLIAGRAWQQPLEEGAHLMTMSTYKSLGGPAGGLIVTDDAALAERLDRIAFPGMTANFDMARIAALCITLDDWRTMGRAYASEMVSCARALADRLAAAGVPVFGLAAEGFTHTHQVAVDARGLGGGHAASVQMRGAMLLASGIGLPLSGSSSAHAADSTMHGVRLGTPEIVRLGMREQDMAELAQLVADALQKPTAAAETAAAAIALRQRFEGVAFAA